MVAIPHPRYPPDPDALALARAVLPSLPGLTPALIDSLALLRMIGVGLPQHARKAVPIRPGGI